MSENLPADEADESNKRNIAKKPNNVNSALNLFE